METLFRPRSNMKLFVCLFVLGMILHGASSRVHSLKYFYTVSSGIPNFPEYVSVGLVDDVQIVQCDSVTKKQHPKQEWMDKVAEGDPHYWERNTQICLNYHQVYKNNIEVVKQRLNQTEGAHIVQYMYGCEWDDETNDVRGYRQYGFDGEDFLFWDTHTNTWIAPRQEAFITKQRWNSNIADLEYRKAYLNQVCPEWLKKYVRYGEKTLMRTELPSISLLQKSSSSPVTCHATGFYPDGAMLFWTKDGEELMEGVDLWEILPNHDGTFQKSADLHVSSVPPEDWGRYSCVFQLSGVKDDIFTKLDKAVIMTNEKPPNPLIIAAAVVGVALLAILGFVLYKKKNAKRPPTPVKEPEVEEQLNPESTE